MFFSQTFSSACDSSIASCVNGAGIDSRAFEARIDFCFQLDKKERRLVRQMSSSLSHHYLPFFGGNMRDGTRFLVSPPSPSLAIRLKPLL